MSVLDDLDMNAPPPTEEQKAQLRAKLEAKKNEKRAGAAPPSARKLPLLSVKFRHPVAIPGCPVMARTLTSGCEVPQGDGARCPQLFYDPDFRVIMIGELLIPCDGYSVESMTRARSAVAGAKS